ncbi:S-adenosylmethionine:tRNA ribosyltransferase-isomerase [Candidatus Solirubrobacter pratensis]|uniref:S-adenosylmethionine:tRNA ribosyltransferase-isomerase n=1 Tax=Candidatus Solirubrobacter pratensis TaxID=1298857 RepID=UPI000404720C|nr:S-adenosylmethionine:tRNA ribosyltransferase-isomerase [Candidatus Solirubrobacter pratensis]
MNAAPDRGASAGPVSAPARGALSFQLPRTLEAGEPPAVRDEVRLMVARGEAPLVHGRFLDLPEHLLPGDLLVVNASATIPAALSARRSDGTAAELHLSTPEPPPAGRPDRWIVELRRGGERFPGTAGEALALPAAGSAELLAPYLASRRLWVARLRLPEPLERYLDAYGAPIRYAHEPHARPLVDHQTIFATEPGSAEMPSAARPFTRRAIAALRARGVGIARLVLHSGVSSLERGERPYPERYRVPAATAARVNAARRVIAVGTTVVRALETVAGEDGTVHAGEGWTSLTVTPERGVRAVDGLLTGWHEPDASHLLMLEAIAGRGLLERSYAAAVARGYRWHEFGDSHLILP